jgi:hypothetical protein
MTKQQNTVRPNEIRQAILWAARGQLAVPVAYSLARAAGFSGIFASFARQVRIRRNALRQGVGR